MFTGILPIDKPIQWTSHDCVSKIRKLTNQKKVGHAGTLDPMATGLLIILLGKATKLFDACATSDKKYTGTITLGVETDTFDFEGKITQFLSVDSFDEHQIHKTMKQLMGGQLQTVPRYSAARINGKRSHRLARSNVEFTPIRKAVSIHDFKCLHYRHPDVYFEAFVEKGTYIRSLAHDLGVSLGCGGALSSLRRISSGFLEVEKSFTIKDLEQMSLEVIEKVAAQNLEHYCHKLQIPVPS